METIALRYADHFAPPEGTIGAHDALIQRFGCVWYGKIGRGLSDKTIKLILQNDPPLILLIHSRHSDRYWANVVKIQKEIPPEEYIPKYYKDKYEKVGVWFCMTKIQPAPRNILSKCIHVSTGESLSKISKSSINPVMLIEYTE